jgi:uncharacterized protein
MLVLLPPSETKRSGGEPGTSLDLGALSFPAQHEVRGTLLRDLMELSADEAQALRALKLGPKGGPEVARNRELRQSPLLPALERYTGVLFDALGLESLNSKGLAWVMAHGGVFSALFGLIRASDRIPAYRLSFDSALAGESLASRWGQVADALWTEVPGFVVDLRSEGYRKLAPVPHGQGVYVALVSEGPPGQRQAVGHANKSLKGQLVRALAESEAQLQHHDDVVDWATTRGYQFERVAQRNDVIEWVISGS